MVTEEITLKILVGFAVGALIGFQRQAMLEKYFAGARTFGLISLTGTLTIFLFEQIQSSFLLIMSVVFVTGNIFFYIYFRIKKTETLGLTTSFAFYTSYFLGILVGIGEVMLAVGTSIFITFILGEKERFSQYMSELTEEEIVSALELGILAILIYPIVPNVKDPFFQVINLKTLYYILILLLGVMFLNYIAIKKWKYRGIYIFSIFGSAVSSEQAVTTVSNWYYENKIEQKNLIPQIVLIADTVMFLRCFFIAFVLIYLKSLFWPMAVVAVSAMFLVALKFKNTDMKKLKEIGKAEIGSPFKILPVLKFVLFFALISILTVYIKNSFPYGEIFSGLVGGLVSSGAVTFSASSMYAEGLIDKSTTIVMILSSFVTGILNKIFYLKISGAKFDVLKVSFVDSMMLSAICVILIFLVYW